jgi:hypothetical protein
VTASVSVVDSIESVISRCDPLRLANYWNSTIQSFKERMMSSGSLGKGPQSTGKAGIHCDLANCNLPLTERWQLSGFSSPLPCSRKRGLDAQNTSKWILHETRGKQYGRYLGREKTA